jgi:hypothetical protein
VNQDTVCFTGPGTDYEIRAYLAGGASPNPLGRTEDNHWWAIDHTEIEASCWLSDEVVSIQGDADSLPVFTPEPTITILPTQTEKPKGVKYYLIAPGTGGPFGCGDGLVYFYSGIPSNGPEEKDIKNALEALFQLKAEYIGQYYNPVHSANLHVNSVEYSEATGKVVVHLRGGIPMPKDACEAKRVHDVIWETVRNSSNINSVNIWVGKYLLGDLIAAGDK